MDEDWRQIIRLLPSFGAHGKLVFEYVELFGINPLRLKGSKVLRILSEMSKLIETGSYTWRKSTRSISKAGVIEALRITCNKNFAEPLENHNYLKKVMLGTAERELKGKRDLADKKQREREESRKHESTKTRKGLRGEGGEVTGAEYRRRQGIESLADQVGKEMP